MVNKPVLVFIVFFLLSSSVGLFCQDNYPVRGTVFVREGKASQVNLAIQSLNTQIKVPVDINGNFTALLEWERDYQFCFSKKGYVSKSINFSTKIPEEVDLKSIYPYEILVELFPMFPNVDTVFFKNPVAKIHYNKTYNDFDFDTDYLLSIKYKLDKAKVDYNKWSSNKKTTSKLKKEEATQKQNLNALNYQNAIEVENKKAVPTPTSKPIINTKTEIAKNPFNLPPLKASYPQGKSIEIHILKGKQITRVIIRKGQFQKIFFKVKHDWGGLYFFVQESPSNYRSISKYNFEKATDI